MKKQSYEKKIRYFLYVSIVIIQMFFFGMTIFLCAKTVLESNQHFKTTINSIVTENMQDLVEQLNDLEYTIEGCGVKDYTTRHYNLLPETQARLKYGEVDDLMSKHTYRCFEKLFVFGRDQNEKSYLKDYDMEVPFEKVFLNYENAQKTGLADYLIAHYQSFFRFRKEDISFKRQLDAKTQEFIDLFDGKVVYVLENNMVVSFREEYLQYLFASYDDASYHVSIYGADGVLVYASNSIASTVIAPENIDAFSKTVTYSKEFRSQRARLFIQIREIQMRWYLLGCAAVFFISSLISAALIERYAQRIMRPYRSLNGIMEMNLKSDRLEKIDLDIHALANNPKLHITQNIFRAFLCVVVLPSIVSLFSYSLILKTANTQVSDKVMKAYQVDIEQKIINSYYQLFNDNANITARDFYILRTPGQPDEYLKNELLRNSIVLDKNANFIYQFSKNIGTDIKNKVRAITADREVIISNTEPGTPDFIMVNKIYDQGTMIGYYCRNLGKNFLGSIRAEKWFEYILYDAYDDVVGASSPELIDAEVNWEYKPLRDMNWTIGYFCNQDIFGIESNKMFNQCLIAELLILIFMFIFAWRYSNSLVLPLQDLANHMLMFKDETVRSVSNYDEVCSIILVYNTMLDKINLLMKEQIEMKKKEQELLLLKSQAEFRALQHQINPHFLYNTLEQINLRIMKTKDYETCDIIVSLTKLFRYSLTKSEEIVPLRMEIDHVQNYIKIQNYRFGKRFICKIQRDPKVEEFAVFKLLIQPLVENAITHGMEDTLSNGEIVIRTCYADGKCIIEVADNGRGMTEEELAWVWAHIRGTEDNACLALRNTYHRIKLYAGDEGDMEIITNFMQGTTIRVTFEDNAIQKREQ